MFQRTSKILFVLLLTPLLVAGCGGKAAPPSTSSTQQPYAPVIDPANFGTTIDNPFMPLVPGTTFVYEGKTELGNEHNEVQVTSDTKVLMGVTCVAVNDTVTVDGKLAEGTIDWYAQDKQGNVWYFGEDTKEYDAKGNVTTTEGTWQAGVDGALPGIIMEAAPKVNDTYRQEYYKGQAEDWATVLSLTETAKVPAGSYDNLLMTNEWSGLDNPTVYEHKYYAAGVGNVKVTTVGAPYELDLIEIRQPK